MTCIFYSIKGTSVSSGNAPVAWDAAAGPCLSFLLGPWKRHSMEKICWRHLCSSCHSWLQGQAQQWAESHAVSWDTRHSGNCSSLDWQWSLLLWGWGQGLSPRFPVIEAHIQRANTSTMPRMPCALWHCVPITPLDGGTLSTTIMLACQEPFLEPLLPCNVLQSRRRDCV